MEMVGLADSDESYEEVVLEEEMDTQEFWEQPEALSDLRKLLKTSIASSNWYEQEEELPVRPVQKISKGFFGKKSQPVTASPKRPQVTVEVGHEDMSYRIENSFGLYDTIAKPAIVVRVNTRA
ncbi:hypothetical protein BT63DRAFT_429421 [Microthyrium microscopicum]|uniref:Uncharacterized protein n=1 Tax=Microthyrium microscopicum TaxID=703497 RepID=A0A6A6TXW5_9PEZI|nr:hypothetical protein BT63DRAFT_429421 [Microthyrium microscopicum]